MFLKKVTQKKQSCVCKEQKIDFKLYRTRFMWFALLTAAVAVRSSNGHFSSSCCCCCGFSWNKLFGASERGGRGHTLFLNHSERWTTLWFLSYTLARPSIAWLCFTIKGSLFILNLYWEKTQSSCKGPRNKNAFSHYNFKLKRDTFSSFIMKGGHRAHPKMKIECETQTTWTSDRIWNGTLHPTIISEWGVTPLVLKKGGHTPIWNHSERWTNLQLSHQESIFFMFCSSWESLPQVIEQSLFLFILDQPFYYIINALWHFFIITD